MDNLAISNLPIFWVLCGITVIISAVQALLYVKEAKKATVACKLDPQLPKQAFRIGMITAIGPACGVFIVMVGLMASIGGPMAWLRLSIIGAAATELTAATLGAQAAGATLQEVATGVGPEELKVLAVAWFTMALNGAGWLVLTGVATPALGKLRDKVSGGDIHWLGALSASCSIGIFGYLNANTIVAKGPKLNIGGTIAILTGAVSMMLLNKFVVPKHRKLAEYTLGIAMVIGIICAIIYEAVKQ